VSDLLFTRSCRHWGRRASCRPAELESDRKFIQSDPAGAADPGFDDSGWTSVSLPHTFNDVDTFNDWSIPGHVGEMNQWPGEPGTARHSRCRFHFARRRCSSNSKPCAVHEYDDHESGGKADRAQLKTMMADAAQRDSMCFSCGH